MKSAVKIVKIQTMELKAISKEDAHLLSTALHAIRRNNGRGMSLSQKQMEMFLSMERAVDIALESMDDEDEEDEI